MAIEDPDYEGEEIDLPTDEVSPKKTFFRPAMSAGGGGPEQAELVRRSS